MLNRRSILLVPALALGLAFAAPATPAFAADVIVFAASSLQNALDDAIKTYTAETGKTVTVSYGGSSALAKQIEQGAPADVFISADEDWMNYLATRKLIKPDTRFDLLGNTLVLIAPTDSALSAKIEPGLKELNIGEIVVLDTEGKPAGK